MCVCVCVFVSFCGEAGGHFYAVYLEDSLERKLRCWLFFPNEVWCAVPQPAGSAECDCVQGASSAAGTERQG